MKTHLLIALLILITLPAFDTVESGSGLKPMESITTKHLEVDVLYNCPTLGGIINIVMTDVDTNQQHYFYITDEGSGTLGSVPDGFYNITLNEGSSYHFSVCGHSTSGTSASFNNVQIDHSCSTINAILYS